MSHRANAQPKPISKSNKRASNKPRRAVPPFLLHHHHRREKPKACTVQYYDHGYTTAYKSPGTSIAASPYDAMRSAVQTTINKAQIIDMENTLMLNVLSRGKPIKGEEISVEAASPASCAPSNGDAPNPGDGEALECEEGRGDSSENNQQAPGMAGNEDDEEYEVEEEEAERIISESEGLSPQEMISSAYHAKKSITEQMRELQVNVMERVAKETDPENLINYFRKEGYFDYNYSHESRTYSGGSGTKKDNLYVIIGLSRKMKSHD